MAMVKMTREEFEADTIREISMIDSNESAKLDQAAAMLGEAWPQLWRSLYMGCIRQKFDKEEALALVTAYILSQNPHGIRP